MDELTLYKIYVFGTLLVALSNGLASPLNYVDYVDKGLVDLLGIFLTLIEVLWLLLGLAVIIYLLAKKAERLLLLLPAFYFFFWVFFFVLGVVGYLAGIDLHDLNNYVSLVLLISMEGVYLIVVLLCIFLLTRKDKPVRQKPASLFG